ncbi:MAG TPA: metalloregulator ArsR/SmtB family transcription factor [Tepidisphaeraceae bacterium]|jgi:DNA-binding transcriptional ArsR family regulator|nr:metalloregulator ArsR/SmtB family transcription factor [Tepidisphaeraceae bacterium]
MNSDVQNLFAQLKKQIEHQEAWNIDLLGDARARPVGDLAEFLRLAQPAVSKHLGVLKKVGLVSVTRLGQQRLYRLNPQELKPVNDWVKPFERYWNNQIDRIKQRAEEKAAKSRLDESHDHPQPRRRSHEHD